MHMFTKDPYEKNHSRDACSCSKFEAAHQWHNAVYSYDGTLHCKQNESTIAMWKNGHSHGDNFKQKIKTLMEIPFLNSIFVRFKSAKPVRCVRNGRAGSREAVLGEHSQGLLAEDRAPFLSLDDSTSALILS